MALGKRLINTGAVAACSTDSVQAFGVDAAYSSNIALYQLDSNANDTTGNYNGTASNVTYATGQFGNAAVFNGSTSYIDTGISSLGANFSVSMWINEDALNSGGFFGNWNGTSNDDMFWLTQSDGSLRINIDGTSNQYFGSAGDVTINTWHHIVVSFNSGTYEVYLDSNSLGTATTSNTVFSSGANFFIGRDAASTPAYFDGKIDQVRIFDKAISAEDVATLYAETTSTASNTNPLSEGAGVALYTMDYDASEASGYYDGTPTNVEFGVGGQINYGARFNGSSSYIDLGTSLLASRSAFSVSTWVNFDNLNTQNFIFYNSESGTGGNVGFYDFGNGSIYFQPDASTSANRGYISNSGIYTTDEWVHIVMVFDGSATGNSNRLKAYIQGTERTLNYDGTIPSSTGTSTASSWIGGRSSTKFSGDIDQVRVFSKALNQSEVDSLYAETACVYTATTTDNYYPLADGSSDAVAYYKLDNSSEDYSTGGNDGTDTNIEYRFGRFGQAAVFNGSSSKIVTTADFDGSTSSGSSISFWFNTTQTTAKALFGSDTIQGGASQGSAVYLGAASGSIADESISFWDFNGSTTSVFYAKGGSTYYQDGNWHHCTIISTSSSKQIWIDGQSQTVYYFSSGSASANAKLTDIIIGDDDTGGGFNFDGKIDQVRIYSTALSSSQVAELYNEKPEVDTSNFKTVLYEGNGGTQYISNVGMDLETDGGLVWVKNRDGSNSHVLQDSVRGTGSSKTLHSDLTAYEGQYGSYGNISSFDANGFFPNAGSNGANNTNLSNNSYVAWVFKGGGEAVQNTQGTINSDVSANTDAGFSIVKYTGNATNGATVGHGLDDAPELVIIKNLDSGSTNWMVKVPSIMTDDRNYLYLNGTDAVQTAGSTTFIKTVNSSIFTLGTSSQTNSTNDFIAYCFHSVAGYSKIGSYTSTGVSGQSITGLGFAPSFVMIKNAGDVGSWIIHDKARNPNNPSTKHLRANSNSSEDTGANEQIDFDSDGFTLNGTGQNINHSDLDTYIYLAFA